MTEQTEEERRDIATTNLAKYFCIIAGIAPVEPHDGGSNWWVFAKEAEDIYDGIRKRFPLTSSELAKEETLR